MLSYDSSHCQSLPRHEHARFDGLRDSRNGTASSAIDKDGKYSVSGLAIGPVKVSLAVPLPISFVAKAVPGAQATAPASKAPALPAKYLDAQESGLGFEVAKGNQTKDYDLPP